MGQNLLKIFINIGTNDIASPDYCLDKLMERYEKIIAEIQSELPKVIIYMMAYYPGNETDKLTGKKEEPMFVTRTNKNIDIANAAVERLAEKMGCCFIDVNEGLKDESGKLRKEFTVEGIHMYANGYQVVLNNLKKYL